jgi:acyl dehydratase
MSENSVISPEARAMIGKETVYQFPEEVGTATIRRFAVAIGDPNPLYYDEEFAKKTVFGGIVAPPTMIFEMIFNIADKIAEEDGGYSEKMELPPPLDQFVRGGNEYEIFQPLRPTDKMTIKRKITNLIEKEGKKGVLVFSHVEFRYFNQKDELLAVNKDIFIHFPPRS